MGIVWRRSCGQGRRYASSMRASRVSEGRTRQPQATNSCQARYKQTYSCDNCFSGTGGMVVSGRGDGDQPRALAKGSSSSEPAATSESPLPSAVSSCCRSERHRARIAMTTTTDRGAATSMLASLRCLGGLVAVASPFCAVDFRRISGGCPHRARKQSRLSWEEELDQSFSLLNGHPISLPSAQS